MTKIEVLFELVRSAVLNREPKIAEDVVVDWDELMCESASQGLIALVWDGICKLPKERQPRRQLRISWDLSAQEIWGRYEQQVAVLREILSVSAENGMRLLLLKGIGLSYLYPSPHSRPAGDLDVFFFDDYEKATRLFCPGESIFYGKHDSFDYHGVHVENHQTPLDIDSPFWLRMQQFIETRYANVELMPGGYYQFDVLTYFVYLVAHTVRHYDLNRGLPLRNIIDLGLYIQKYKNDISTDESLRILNQLELSMPFETLLYFAEWTLNLSFPEFHEGLIDEKDLNIIRSVYFDDGLNNRISSDLPYYKWVVYQCRRYFKVSHLKKYLYRGTDNYLKQVVRFIGANTVRRIFSVPTDKSVIPYLRERFRFA